MLNRRYQVVLGLFTICAIALVLLSKAVPVDVPAVNAVTDRLPESIRHPNLPGLPKAINPFAPSAHKPPVQANSSSGEISWYADWRWRNPFSWSVTLDENREVLPPLPTRPPVYTFYEPNSTDPKAVRHAEEKLLLQWRRAWWAQGFKPIVLGRPEAINNPLYRKVQRLQLKEDIEVELARWLAWGNMGTGILTNWLAFPMASYDDSALSYLRRGEFPELTRFEGLHAGLFCGDKVSIQKTIDQFIGDAEIKDVKSLADTRFDSLFRIEPQPSSIALYDTQTIEKKYKSIAKSLFTEQTKAEGLRLLSSLINAHLHATWQSTFSSGIAVMRPLGEHMTTVFEAAVDVATNLTQCPWSPEPTTCPPNRPKCKKCLSSQPLAISTPPTYQNRSGVFHVGMVPHPYTTLAMAHGRDSALTARFVRRLGAAARDPWLTEVTKDVVGTGPSSARRLTLFKEAVAAPHARGANALWLTAEKPDARIEDLELDWVFGFDVPAPIVDLHTSETPVPGPERRPKIEKVGGGKELTELERERELKRLGRARDAVHSKDRQIVVVRDAVEAWCMADTEAWRFARAFAARRMMERRMWEEEEKSFYGAEKKASWGRWWDGKK